MKRLYLTLILLASLLSSVAVAAERRVVVIFVQFQDLSFTGGRSEFKSFTDSLSLYFTDQFFGKTSFRFDAGPVITLSRNYAYYGSNSPDSYDALMYRGVEEACKAAADSIDFSLYSNGSLSTVKDVLIMVPGMPESESGVRDMFWPQYVSLTDKGSGLYVSGRRITEYGLACELGPDGRFAGIGSMAHEYCHILGLSDMYDTDGEGSGGRAKALWGVTSIMDEGYRNAGGHVPPSFNAADYYTLGEGRGEVMDKPGYYTLRPISEEGHYYIFKGGNEGEVFLVENRWNAGWDSYIGGYGMLIYHWDKSAGDALWSDFFSSSISALKRWEHNEVNCNPAHQCVELVAPDDNLAFFPTATSTDFSSETTPAFRFWNGESAALAFTDITRNADLSVSFTLIKPLSIYSCTPFQNSFIMHWTCDERIDMLVDSCLVNCYAGEEIVAGIKGSRLEEGGWGCNLGGLSPNTEYRLEVQVYRRGSIIFSGETSAVTLSSRKGISPFIYLKDGPRNADGSFPRGARIPLQVFNSTGAQSIRWFFDKQNITAGRDGLFTLDRSGTLRAEVYWEDGSHDIFIKEVTVK